MPDPDFIIRPSGEYRLSNYLIWQSAYAEYWFSNVLWPDFSSKHLDSAIEEYSRRNRRFGELIGSGLDIESALHTVGMTVESYYATAAAYALAQKYQVEMPIVNECYDILYNNGDVSKVPAKLMSRSGKNE